MNTTPKTQKLRFKRSFSWFGIDIYFKPEYTTSMYADALGRGKITGYSCMSAEKSDRGQHADKYTSCYKMAQRILVRNNYLQRLDEFTLFAIPNPANNSHDVGLIYYKEGKITADPKAFEFFQSHINGKLMQSNKFVDMIVKYLQHFSDTGQDIKPELHWRHKITKKTDPKFHFADKFFTSKDQLVKYCEGLQNLGYPIGRCQAYFEKMREKNNLY